MEVVTALERTWSRVIALLESLDSDEWELPTPDGDWDVKDLAAHLGGMEAFFQGFPQPDPPEEWSTDHSGLHFATAVGVAARSSWTTGEVLDEMRRASQTQLERLRGLSEDGWQEQTMGPVGMTTRSNLADLRLGDLYVHLLDLRYGLEMPLGAPEDTLAEQLAVERAVRLSGWGSVKGAGLPDGTRIRFELSGVGGVTGDLLVTDRRGSFEPPGPPVLNRLEGPGLAYLLEVSGRHGMAEAAGGLVVEGEAARALLDGYRLFG